MCPKAYPSCAFIPIPAKIPIKILSTLHSNFNIVKNLEFFLFCPFFVYSPRIADKQGKSLTYLLNSYTLIIIV